MKKNCFLIHTIIITASIFIGTLQAKKNNIILIEDTSLRNSTPEPLHQNNRFSRLRDSYQLETFDNGIYSVATHSEISNLKAKTKEWGFFLYCAADNNLHRYARQNIAQLFKQGSSTHAHIVVHHEEFGASTSKRLYVKKRELAVLEEYPRRYEHATGTRDGFINFVTWAYHSFPSKKQAISLWNHGSGIMDPAVYGRSWLPESIPLIYNKETELFEYSHDLQNNSGRGVLFNDTFRTYLRNEDLRIALEQIHKNIGGKKIDLVIFDTCHMGMVEIATKIRPYVSWMTASEEVEPGIGIDYSEAIALLHQPNVSAEKLASTVVSSYAKQFANLFADFTHSAIDLSKVEALEESFTLVSSNLKKLIENPFYGKDIALLIKQMRNNKKLTTSFYYRDFIDLNHFLKSLRSLLALVKQDSNAFLTCHQTVGLINQTLAALEECVKYNAVGCNVQRAGGLALYFPTYNIHFSYKRCIFSQKTGWGDFLTSYLAATQ